MLRSKAKKREIKTELLMEKYNKIIDRITLSLEDHRDKSDIRRNISNLAVIEAPLRNKFILSLWSVCVALLAVSVAVASVE
jgi:hypothetical protein